MNALHQQTCLRHATREAVARCPECGHFYCRECITEHDDRVICAACLRKILRPAEKAKGRFAGVLRLGGFGLGLLTAWVAFYFVGRVLVNVPAQFHDSALWRTTIWQQ